MIQHDDSSLSSLLSDSLSPQPIAQTHITLLLSYFSSLLSSSFVLFFCFSLNTERETREWDWEIKRERSERWNLRERERERERGRDWEIGREGESEIGREGAGEGTGLPVAKGGPILHGSTPVKQGGPISGEHMTRNPPNSREKTQAIRELVRTRSSIN
jgi:hypothetical protein